MSFSYGELIRDAFRISWRNKFLWFFGFFVAGGGGLSGNFNAPTNFGGGDFGGGVPTFIQNNLVALIIAAVTVGVILFLLFLILGIVSSGGLASSVAAIDGGEQRRFGTTWRAGLSVFWRVLLQGILLALISLGLTIVILVVCGIPVLLTFLLTQSVAARIVVAVLFALLAVLLFIVIFIPFAIVAQLALRELVVGGGGIARSISSAYRLFRRNLGRSLLVWLLNIGLKIGVGIATLIAYLILGAILVGPGIGLYAAGYTTVAIVLGIIGGLIFLVPVIVISGAVGAFFHAYWTLAYLRLTASRGPDSQAGEGAQAA